MKVRIKCGVLVGAEGIRVVWLGVRLLGVHLTALHHLCAMPLEDDAVRSQTLSMHGIALPC